MNPGVSWTSQWSKIWQILMCLITEQRSCDSFFSSRYRNYVAVRESTTPKYVFMNMCAHQSISFCSRGSFSLAEVLTLASGVVPPSDLILCVWTRKEKVCYEALTRSSHLFQILYSSSSISYDTMATENTSQLSGIHWK